MTSTVSALRKRMLSAVTFGARRDEGQGTLEYVGAVVIAAIVVVAVTAAFSGLDIGGVVTEATNKIFGRG